MFLKNMEPINSIVKEIYTFYLRDGKIFLYNEEYIPIIVKHYEFFLGM